MKNIKVINKDYLDKVELLNKHLTIIPDGNIIKLIKQVNALEFIEIMLKVLDSKYMYDILSAREDMEKYHINETLVLTNLILKIKGEIKMEQEMRDCLDSVMDKLEIDYEEVFIRKDVRYKVKATGTLQAYSKDKSKWVDSYISIFTLDKEEIQPINVKYLILDEDSRTAVIFTTKREVQEHIDDYELMYKGIELNHCEPIPFIFDIDTKLSRQELENDFNIKILEMRVGREIGY